MKTSKLYLGDCLAVLKRLKTASVNMVLADLPYGTTACKWDTVIPFEPLWAELNRVCMKNAAVLHFSQAPFDKVLAMSNLGRFKYEWIWEKEAGTGFLNAKKAPLKSHENILVFYCAPPVYNPQFELGKAYTSKRGRKSDIYGMDSKDEIITENKGKRYPKTVLRFQRDRNRVHPTQKPVALLEYLIKTYTNPGDTVLDPTMGSGSAGVAALNLGRRFIGIEKDPKYFEIAQERIALGF